jgi:hypothetical protein
MQFGEKGIVDPPEIKDKVSSLQRGDPRHAIPPLPCRAPGNTHKGDPACVDLLATTGETGQVLSLGTLMIHLLKHRDLDTGNVVDSHAHLCVGLGRDVLEHLSDRKGIDQSLLSTWTVLRATFFASPCSNVEALPHNQNQPKQCPQSPESTVHGSRFRGRRE